jgi:hypothetical protein
LTKITTQCPTCEKQFQVPPDFVGKTATCSRCKLKFTVTPFLEQRTDSPLPASPAPAPSRQLPPAQPQPVVVHKTTGCLKVSLIGAGVAGVLMLMLCGGMLSLLQKASDANKKKLEAMTPQERREYDINKVYEEAQFTYKRRATEFITERLKAPTTAKIDLETRGDKRKLVLMYSGTVTSQNSFGAMLTKPVAVVYARPTVDSAFELTSFTFESDSVVFNEKLQSMIRGLMAEDIGK